MPEFAKLLGNCEGTFTAIENHEEEFLNRLISKDLENRVKLSAVKFDSKGNIVDYSGPLKNFKEKIVKINLRKRYVIVETSIKGKKQEIILGLTLENNEEI